MLAVRAWGTLWNIGVIFGRNDSRFVQGGGVMKSGP